MKRGITRGMTGEGVYAVPVLIELVKVFNRLQNITSPVAEESKATRRRRMPPGSSFGMLCICPSLVL